MPSGYSSFGERASGSFIVVTGCYAQLKPGQVADIEGVDLVLGAEQKGDLMKYLGNLEKHEHGEAITTATKDIRTLFLHVLEVTVPVIS